MTLDAIKAGKNVFVEKPLCLTEDELEKIVIAIRQPAEKQTVGNRSDPTKTGEGDTTKQAADKSASAPSAPMIVVGFNRRFAPLAIKMKQLLVEGPKNIIATMNAGFIPPEAK
jgi:predicted dehydrogenase